MVRRKLSKNQYVLSGKVNQFMKAVVAFFLPAQVLASSLLPGFGVDQSARLVELAEHFQEHRQADPTLGFLTFMAMHYGLNSEHQKHPNHSHHNLPSVGHSVPAFAPSPLALLHLGTPSTLRLAQSACFRYANLYSFLSVRSLINPPRSRA